MLLFVDLLKPYVLFIGGVKFGTPSTKMSKQIFLPPKDLAFQWPCPLFEIWANTSMLFSGGKTSPPH
jgi:hypothetical protein